MKQKILVVGDNGLIGCNMVMYALSLGWDVSSLSLSGSGKPLWAIYYYIWNCMITSIRRIDFDNISIVLLK